MNNKGKKLIAAFAVLLVLYNLIVLIAGGFSGHDGVYWLAYAFGNIFLITVPCVLAYEAGKHHDIGKLIFYGYSITKWSFFFMIVELVIATVFMLIDDYFKLALILLIIPYAVYIIIILMCRTTEELIVDVREKRGASVATMKGLTLTAKSLIAAEDDEEVKKKLEKLADRFVYSDIVSSPATEEIENKIGNLLSDLKNGNLSKDAKLSSIAQTEKLLAERNAICYRNK